MAFWYHQLFLIICCALLVSQAFAKSAVRQDSDARIFNDIGNAILRTVKDCKAGADNTGSQITQCVTDGLETVEKIKIPQIVADGLLSSGSNILNHVGKSVIDTISSDKQIGNTGTSVLQNIGACLESVKNISENTAQSLENVKNISQTIASQLDLIKNISNLIVNDLADVHGSFAIATGKIVLKVTRDVFEGKELAHAMVDRTIEILSKMDLKIAYFTRSVLKRIQMLQNGDSIGTVIAEIARAIVTKCVDKIKILFETVHIFKEENIDGPIRRITKALEEKIKEKFFR